VLGAYLLTPQTEPLVTAQTIVGCAPAGVGPPPGAVGVASTGNTSKPPDHWFNFTLLVGPSNLSFRYLWPNLTSGRSNVAFPPGAGLEVISHKSGAWEATFVPGAGWTYQSGFGPSSPVRDGDLLSIFWTGSDPATVAGDVLSFDTPCGATGEFIT
jgi:hypothetical protein